ncbi:MAG: hypothetical protein HY693_03775 [Deltaproteobacteria bacterium]|nr:hypothetical protein [Deltaproteobacteria bacterium]
MQNKNSIRSYIDGNAIFEEAYLHRTIAISNRSGHVAVGVIDYAGLNPVVRRKKFGYPEK